MKTQNRQTRTLALILTLILSAIFVRSLALAKSDTLTANPPASTLLDASQIGLKGTVYLQGALNHANVEVSASTDRAITGYDGKFELYVNSPFTLYLSAYGYLAANVQGYAAGTEADLGTITMLAGDLNADHKIDIFDLTLVSNYYDSVNPLGDINRDGWVGISDIALIAANYGVQGPTVIVINPPPNPSPTAPGSSKSVSGVVYDPAGNTVSGATVNISGANTQETQTSDSYGRWTSGLLPPGKYEFRTFSPNFRDWSAPRIIDIATNSNIVLTLAPLTNAVSEGDFEGGYIWGSWEQFDGSMTQSTNGFDGQYALTMGQGYGQQVTCYQNNRPGELWTLKQRVTIPDIDYAGLSFVYKTATTQNVFDYAWFEVVLMVDGVPHYLEPWGQLWQNTDWTVKAYDLSRWRGQSVDLRFQTVHCSAQDFTATLDRVSIGSIKDLLNPSGPEYQGSYRKQDACENMGKHNLFIYVLDRAGNGIPGVNVKVTWPDGESVLKTGEKIEHAGLADFPMYPGSYHVQVVDGTSDVVGPLSTNIYVDEVCPGTGAIGNSYGHYSYDVTFVKN